jgi:excisionase family DNA binding protein
MPTFRIKEAADLLGISHDTLRRWADGGRIATTTDATGRMAVDGVALATLAQELAESADHSERRMVVAHSVRNRFSGLVSRVVRDTVMAQVEIQAGPHRFVSLLSREAADELGLEPGNASGRRRQGHQRLHRDPQDQLTKPWPPNSLLCVANYRRVSAQIRPLRRCAPLD